MDHTDLIARLLNDPAGLPALVAPLDDASAAEVVDHLKQEADRHWTINANRSLEIAELIVAIGQARGDRCQIALGTMARGDALKLLGRTGEAWQTLARAGELFIACGDEVGWARTRIGRLLICVDLGHVDDALADADRARDIFARHNRPDKRLDLDLNAAIVYGQLGEHRKALEQFHAVLATARALGEDGQLWLGLLQTDIGLTYEALGDLRQAITYHERARDLFVDRGEVVSIATAELNLARIAIAQGRYRQALDLLHGAHDRMVAEQIAREAAHISGQVVECYMLLNRYAESRDLAQQVIGSFRAFGASYEEALTLLQLASAEANLANPAGAFAALNEAERVFTSLNAPSWIATTRLRRGRVALQQGDAAAARREAEAAAECFDSGGQQVNYAMAAMLQGQAAFAAGDFGEALQRAATGLRIARQANVPPLRYTGHLLLGHVAEAARDDLRAARRYRAAAATVERVQRGLTMTLRPGFLEDKGEALRALIGLELRNGRGERAFESLERAKSQILLGQLANREQLRWASDDPRSRALIEELDRLREEHHWFYGIAHEQPGAAESHHAACAPEQALREVAARERRMRAITEQLYLRGDHDAAAQVAAPPLRDVQRSLGDETLLIEFYNDGARLWAFALDTAGLSVHELPATVGEIDRLLAQLQLNIAAALKSGPAAPLTRGLAGVAQRILSRLHAVLLEPLASRMRAKERLMVVPYGALHYLPFHLLRGESAYLVERYEIIILPAASLATRRGPRRPPGALVLAHSLNGHLPQTMAEGRMVARLFGGQAYCDQAAQRGALRMPPSQILHIAAHGQHRLDQPDLSYIQLADGQLYADDLVQHDLSYELVTLSACETGRANVAAGDELIGLGRRVLYAGAGALVASLWRVADESAIALMDHMYRDLLAGASKAAALRRAQRAALHGGQQPHPAFWGAFQLVGDASPLSTEAVSVAKKEHSYDSITAAAHVA